MQNINKNFAAYHVHLRKFPPCMGPPCSYCTTNNKEHHRE